LCFSSDLVTKTEKSVNEPMRKEHNHIFLCPKSIGWWRPPSRLEMNSLRSALTAASQAKTT
jgi:hypothetical protein